MKDVEKSRTSFIRVNLRALREKHLFQCPPVDFLFFSSYISQPQSLRDSPCRGMRLRKFLWIPNWKITFRINGHPTASRSGQPSKVETIWTHLQHSKANGVPGTIGAVEGEFPVAESGPVSAAGYEFCILLYSESITSALLTPSSRPNLELLQHKYCTF